MTETPHPTGLERLQLFASALAGQPVAVEPATAEQAAWTDGQTIFVNPGASPRQRLAALTGQACLIAAGSLEPDIMRTLARRPKLARRYLAVEIPRALMINEALIPVHVASLFRRSTVDTVETSAADASLALALSDASIADPPLVFGSLAPRKVLAKLHAAEKKSESSTHIPRSENKKQPLAELTDEDADDNEDLDDPFSSPVGGGGAIGKLLGRMLSMVRKLSGGGQPGADSPTHRLNKGAHGRNAVFSQARPPTDDRQADERRGTTYPEWDLYHRRYRSDWCAVHEIGPPLRPDAHLAPSDAGLRRPLARLGMGLQHYRRQADGDDIDIDAAIEARTATLAGAAPEERVYLDTLRRRRDLSVLVLLDVSGSVAEPGTAGKTVHEQQRASAAMLAVALHALGDRVALYAFSSQGRSAVNVTPVKQFHEPVDAVAMCRLYGLVPGAYSRLGAAIRHSAAILEEHAGTPRRLLVVISDGLAYDPGYERDYGAADSRRALAEARQRGTGCLCLTIGASTDVAELRKVFGSAAHAAIAHPDDLPRIIGPLFRSALRSAEARRRIGQRKRQAANITRHSDRQPPNRHLKSVS